MFEIYTETANACVSHASDTNLPLVVLESSSKSSRSAPESLPFPSFGNFDHSVETKRAKFCRTVNEFSLNYRSGYLGVKRTL